MYGCRECSHYIITDRNHEQDKVWRVLPDIRNLSEVPWFLNFSVYFNSRRASVPHTQRFWFRTFKTRPSNLLSTPFSKWVSDLQNTEGETLSSLKSVINQFFLSIACQVQPTQLSSHSAHVSCHFQEVIIRKKPAQMTSWIPVTLVLPYFPALPVLLAYKRKKWCRHNLFLMNLFSVDQVFLILSAYNVLFSSWCRILPTF